MQVKTSKPPQQTRVIRGDDLASALAKVRMVFGPDALVIGTRQVVIPDPESLSTRSQVEVTIADAASEASTADMSSATTTGPSWAQAYADSGTDSMSEPSDAPTKSPLVLEASPSDEDVASRIKRLKDIAHHVESLTARFEEVDDETIDYPLATALREQGTTEKTLRHLAGSFRLAIRGGVSSHTAARRHLSRFVRGTKAYELKQMRGEHWLLGRAASGKTSLALFLAGSLKSAAVDVALVAVAPPHEGDRHRLREAGKALEIPVRIVRDESEMQTVRAELSQHDIVIVDTPCFLGQELPILPPDHAQTHLVVPLGEDRELLRGHLDAAVGWQADCLAITQMDLFPRPGRLVDLAIEAGRPISLIQGRQAGVLRVHVARGEALLSAVLNEAAPGTV